MMTCGHTLTRTGDRGRHTYGLGNSGRVHVMLTFVCEVAFSGWGTLRAERSAAVTKRGQTYYYVRYYVSPSDSSIDCVFCPVLAKYNYKWEVYGKLHSH